MTKRNNIFGIILLLAAGLLAGCRFADDPERRYEIAVSTGVTGLQNRVASVNNASDLQSCDLKIDAYFNGTNVEYLDDAMLVYDVDRWRFDDGSDNELHYYWPIEGSVYDPADNNITYTSLDFVGFCPFEKPTYIGDPTYDAEDGVSFSCDLSSYMTLANQSSMPEFLVGIANEQTIATQTANDGVPLQFKHPFALVKFVINAASGTHVRIDSIGIDDLSTTGTCTYNGTTISWDDLDDQADMSLVGVNLTVGGTTETDTIIVIPGIYNTHLTVKSTWTEWSNVTISDYGTDISFDWEPGHSYIYNLTVDKYGLKVDVQKYTEQW